MNFLIKKNRVKEGKFPEYEESLNIQNVSPLDSEVNFCFLEESTDKADSCFFLEPNELSLKPNETKVKVILNKKIFIINNNCYIHNLSKLKYMQPRKKVNYTLIR
jgi:hypothetical protein